MNSATGHFAAARKRVSLTLTAVLAVSALSAIAFGGCGGGDEPTVPAGAIAVIEHVPPGRGEITKAELGHQIKLDGLGGNEIELGTLYGARSGHVEYELAKNAAMDKLVTRRWIEGEAEELGVTVSDREVAKKIRLSELANKIRHTGKPYGPGTLFPTKADAEEAIRESASTEKIELKTKDESPRAFEGEPEFRQKWQARTYCAPKFMREYCANSPTAEE